MCTPLRAAALALLLASPASQAADLTDTEQRWLKAGWPVVAYARQQNLPLDIVVQPQPTPGAPPIAMGFVDKRCKLVLSMRGNAAAERTLAQIDPELLGPVVEAMVAHELGHCWRYVNGAWSTVPAGFDDTGVVDPALDELRHDMRETRREEGFADLVGLAWTLSRHPQHYERVHAWFATVRERQPLAGAHHDTRVWIGLAKQRGAFGSAADPFRQAWPLWQQGLSAEP
ncbi:hypothetical protein [Piscinibacter sp.]|uniref:hypothetical protein n=1 Tax=Piscinibacter sp. TaxID=1903157 RepID=UPI002C800938|nr:hypothetical protein [Albitalea sp.]HUG25522.1 hypothetical protein [Albitalea sp.]